MRRWAPGSSNLRVFLSEDFILLSSPEAEKADETPNLPGLLALRIHERGSCEDRSLRMGKMNEIPIKVNGKLYLLMGAPLHFGYSFSREEPSCGPEAGAWRAESISGKRILPGDPAVLPENGAGPSGAQPGAPTTPYPRSWRKNGLPAPANEGMRASWFLRAAPLLPGLATPEIQVTLRLLDEK